MSPCPCLHASGIPQTENRTNGKQQLPNVTANGKQKTPIYLLHTETENGTVFLGQQLTKGN
jgi:hypothetical protein